MMRDSQYAIRILLLHAIVFFVHFALIGDADSLINHHHHRPPWVSLRLIHRDSVHSPYYNPKDTIADRARYAIESSEARVAYLMSQRSSSSNNSSLPPIVGYAVMHNPLVTDGGVFFVNISIGQPPVPVLLVMDTGSSLTWAKCQACSGPCPSKVFNYLSSSTFKKGTCESPYCGDFFGQCAKDKSSCEFNVRYNDRTQASGFLAEETFSSEVSESITALRHVMFGCAASSFDFLTRSSGILGLGATSFSMPWQVNWNFSYCIGNISDPTYTSNQLILGIGSIMQGDPTSTQVTNRGEYYVSLESIVIGDTRIEVPPGDNKFNTLFDSGTTISYLVESSFRPLMREVRRLLGPVEYFDDGSTKLCFKGSMETLRSSGFPMVTLELGDGVDLAIDIEGFFFRKYDNIICAAVGLSPDDRNLIGVVAQQFYNVGFNMAALKIYFQRTDCALLQD